METLPTIEQVRDNDKALWDLFDTVPFGNSLFQTKQFVANQLSPARARRQILLELHERGAALHRAGVERERKEIQIRRKRRQIAEKEKLLTKDNSEEIAEDIDLLSADIRELEFDLKTQSKLAADALEVVKCLLACLHDLPACTREDFEKDEPEYWKKRLVMEAERNVIERGSVPAGLLETLNQLGFNPHELTTELSVIAATEKAKTLEKMKAAALVTAPHEAL